MTLELVVGPVRSGKLGALLGRFSDACEAGARPLLLVPAAFERDALERDACERAGALLGGEVVTLDTLVERVLGGEVEVASEALERVVRRRIGHSHGPALGLRPVALASALERLARECDRAGAPPGALERAPGGDARLAPAYAAYEAALAETGRARRGRLVVRAAERLERELAAWDGAPVFAYGFDDLSPAQLRLLAALAGRCDLLLALPYEPGRPLLGSLDVAFEWLAARAERVEELRAARLRRTAERRRSRTRGVLGAQRAPAGCGRCRAADRGGGHRWRGDGRRGRGLPAPAARADPRRGARRDARRLRLRAARRRARARRRRGRGRHERAPHEPPRRQRTALALPRGLGGRRSRRPLRLAPPGRLDVGRLAGARLRGALARAQHHRGGRRRARAAGGRASARRPRVDGPARGERSAAGAAHAGRCRALARLRQPSPSWPRRGRAWRRAARSRQPRRPRTSFPRPCRGPTATTCWRRWMPCRYAWGTGCRGAACASSASAWPGSRPCARSSCAGSRRACSRAASPPRPRARPSCGVRSRPPACPATGRGRRSAIASCSRRPWRASTSISRSCAARPTTTASSSLPRPSGTRSCACSETRRRSP